MDTQLMHQMIKGAVPVAILVGVMTAIVFFIWDETVSRHEQVEMSGTLMHDANGARIITDERLSEVCRKT